MMNLIFLLVSMSFAEDLVPDTQESLQTDAEMKEGWNTSGVLGANVSINSNNAYVVGQVEGDAKTFGFSSKFDFNYKKKRKEWRNNLTVNAAQTTAPPINRYIKSSDEFAYQTTYLYSLESRPWLGPYVRGKMQTTLFKGEDVRADNAENAVDYSIDGQRLNEQLTTFKLTDAFSPMTTRVSTGVFAKIAEVAVARLGVGTLAVNAGDALIISDNEETTNVVELTSLKSYSQTGLELGIDYKNQLDEKTTITFELDYLLPLTEPDIAEGESCFDCSTMELAEIDVNFKVSSKVTTWMSLDYQIRYRKQPQLVNKDQVSNMFLANFTYSVL